MPGTANRPQPIREQLAIGPWYAEGRAAAVAEQVLNAPKRFDDLFECLLDPDKGVSKRAAFALMLVSELRADLFQPYRDILLEEIARQERWFVRYRLCRILPRLKLNAANIAKAAGLFEAMLQEPKIALNVAALDALAELTLLDPSRREDTVWLIEEKMRNGSAGIQARARMLLKRLNGRRKANRSSVLRKRHTAEE